MKTCLEICLVFLLVGLLRSAPAADWYVATNGAGWGTNGWADATNSLQGAIGKSAINDTIWVSNGVYDTGGITNYPNGTVLTNRIAITKAITVRSKDNDPANTVIKGNRPSGPAAIRCVYMAAGSTLIGITVTNGGTFLSGAYNVLRGGGIYSADTTVTISNCLITGNTAQGGDGSVGGGGVYSGTLRNCVVSRNSTATIGGGTESSILYNCMVISNSASSSGGGVQGGSVFYCLLTGNTSAANGGGANGATLYDCLLIGNVCNNGGAGAAYGTLYNCTLTGNYSNSQGGGIRDSTLYNCIVYLNTASDVSSSNYWGGTFIYSCTAPAVAGAGNITGNPLFIDKGSNYGTNHVAGNYRLTRLSPCINAGTNFAWMTTGSVTNKDLDGRQRVKYGTVDMGAYEQIRAGTVYGVR